MCGGGAYFRPNKRDGRMKGERVNSIKEGVMS